MLGLFDEFVVRQVRFRRVLIVSQKRGIKMIKAVGITNFRDVVPRPIHLQ